MSDRSISSETLTVHAPGTTAAWRGRRIRGAVRVVPENGEKNREASAQQLTSRRSYFDAISSDIGELCPNHMLG